MKHIIFIALGGSLGATARYLIAKNIQIFSKMIFPVGTLFVNITGSFIIGFLFYLFDNIIVSRDIKSFLTVGFLGAYTTFSTYSLESVNMLRDGELKLGISNMLLNNFIALSMVILGMLASKYMLKVNL